ncbi:hypothetical protein I3843_11G184000 [Carya illinoinensis]|uniref:Uncharacterized protein n=1 Tax=Carya illinoinensis TaxID=32201 RepID=A0A8T1P7X8_CARIL|nr:uncharacterized protein LOC122282533 [Carya illinoinensis]KAG2682256.1 hypothetical protein I3760_11G183300 [Carya illinoinensis]KAG6637593.1 hypothetical protein CIPAW_11G189000 [Carya illinoinensis]KAG6689657.1 hypothetical protein I3842_11G186100 [Carya illinoinensis]KAG7957597.1 hypothetical protein I3843_11G184000 [Carya illinoinensis]
MGNCLRHGHDQSSMQWGGDDWGCPEKDEFGRLYAAGRDKRSHEMAGDDKASKMEEKGLLGHDRGRSISSSATATSAASTITEVKIKITRKQLEELLGSVDIKDLTVHQVLAQLMNASDQYETHQRSWRPALQTIPEGN